MYKFNRKIPLLFVLVAPFVFLSIFAVSITWYLSYHNSQVSVKNVSIFLRREINSRIETHIRNFLDIPHRINKINASIPESTLLNPEKQEALQNIFREQIKVFDSVTSIYFGNIHGGVANSGREGAGGGLYVIGTDNFKRGAFRKYAVDNSGRRINQLLEVPDFDARTRPWFTGAVEKGGAGWSSVYVLFTGQDMAISASYPVFDSNGTLLGVAAVDLFLSHLDTFLESIEIGKTGISFIIEPDSMIIASSTGDNSASAGRRVNALESSSYHVSGAVESMLEQFESLEKIDFSSDFDFVVNREKYSGFVTPLKDLYGLEWLIVTVIPESDFTGQINDNNKTVLYLLLFMLLAIISISIVITGKIIRPVLELENYAELLSKGEWRNRNIYVSRIKEIGALTRTFNFMADEIQKMVSGLKHEISQRSEAEKALTESNAQLNAAIEELEKADKLIIEQERFAAVGQLTSGIAHDFNNILTVINGFSEILENSFEADSSAKQILKDIRFHGSRASHLVRQLLDYSRKSIRQPGKFDMRIFLKQTVDNLKKAFPDNISINLYIPPETVPGNFDVIADRQQIAQVINNLADNAKNAMPGGGNIDITLYHFTAEKDQKCLACSMNIEGSWICIKISDTGYGIPDNIKHRIFEPFFTTREVGKGSGLGLSQVYGIIMQHQGHIIFKSEQGKGTEFTLFLAAASENTAELSEPSEPSEPVSSIDDRNVKTGRWV